MQDRKDAQNNKTRQNKDKPIAAENRKKDQAQNKSDRQEKF